jgi:thiosulfate reductase cytochrome b subunit
MAPGLANQKSGVLDSPRHSAVVRVTHWIHSISFIALVVSGVAILIAHPRLYWGETGTLGTPALLDLPIPLTLGNSGWGRYLHFLAAWVGVFNGLLYVVSGILARHFSKHFLRPYFYNTLQRLAYLAVVFVLFPLMIVTGLAMSPAITSVIPALVDVFGGHQSARSIHFFAASFLVLFLLVHVAMVWRAGFTNRMRDMITGHSA